VVVDTYDSDTSSSSSSGNEMTMVGGDASAGGGIESVDIHGASTRCLHFSGL
jgi:hypothetical protein